MAAESSSSSSSSPSSTTESEAPQPVGQGDYVVKKGDCLTSISEAAGHFWETVWNDPANEELKTEREDPNVLMPGDKLTIPDLRKKEESKPPEKRHRYRRKGVPAKLNLQFLDHGEPRADQDYLADIDGHIEKGKTDPDGTCRCLSRAGRSGL